MPEVCVNKWRIVMPFQLAGVFFKYKLMWSSNEILPCSTNSIMHAAVNCLVTEPISKTVLVVAGTFHSRLAKPYAAVFISWPCCATFIARPGIWSFTISVVTISSTGSAQPLSANINVAAVAIE